MAEAALERIRTDPDRIPPTPSRRKHALSVIVISLDEADRIRACLESVRDLADEIIVVDGGSTDSTTAICREYTDRVFTARWEGDGQQKQHALEKATREWVLRIDADERVSPELASEIGALLDRPVIGESAFRIPWATYCFGRYLKHGELGTHHYNLFRRAAAHYEPEVHARLVVEGTTGRLSGRLYHDANRSYGHLIGKLCAYATASARVKRARGDRGGLGRAIVHSAWRFVKVYVFRLGFLDGRRGLMMAIVYSQYVFNKYAAMWADGQPGLPDQDNWRPPPR